MLATPSTLFTRSIAAGALACAAALAAGSVAFAHNEFEPGEVAPGSIVALTLSVENESSTAGTTSVELQFPQPLVVVELPEVAGWTAEPVDGSIGAEAMGVVWSRETADPSENPSLPLTIGPLPDIEGRLQFKSLQTYSDGTQDAWIQEWPVGTPEPDRPGPVLDLVIGAPGTVPSETTPAPEATTEATEASAAPPETSAATTAATTAETTAEITAEPTATTEPILISPAPTSNPADSDSDSDDDSSGWLIAGGLAAVLLAAVGAFVLFSRRKES